MSINKFMLAGCIVLLWQSTSLAQSVNTLLNRANKHYELHAYNLAIQTYREVLDRRPNEEEALVKIADCYRHLNEMTEAAKYYARAVVLRNAKAEVKLQYGHVLKALGNYEEARRWYQEAARELPVEGNHFAQTCVFARQQQNTPPAYNVASEFINSTASDFGPAFYGDGQVVFASARTDIQRTSTNWTGGANNQLFIANVASRSGFLEAPFFLRNDLRNNFNEAPVAYTSDKTWVAFTKNNFVDGTRHIASSGMRLELFIGEVNVNGDWINVRPFPYNGADFSVGFPAFSPDGRALYFASNRPDGFGGYDIYVSFRVGSSNNWSAPQNLGSVVNSPGNEVTPCFDNGTLYFSSDWHAGLGGYDVFRAEQSDGRWTQVFHLGTAINSSYDDYGFIFNNFRNRGYLVSNRPGGRGREDIYRVNKSAESVVIRVRSASDGSPVANALIDFSLCGDRAYETDARGVYNFQAVRGLDCNVLVRREGFQSRGVQLSMVNLQPNREVEVFLARIGEEYLGRTIAFGTRLPLDETTVTATNQTTNSSFTVRTDVNGDYILPMAPNTTYIVRYSRPGYRDINRTVRTGSSFDRDLLGTTLMVPADVIVTEPPVTTGETTTPKGSVERGFAVQVASLATPNLIAFADLRNIGNLYYKEEGRRYKIRLGVYATREEAERIQRLARNQGYTGAFIVQETGGQAVRPTEDLRPKTPVPTPVSATAAKFRIQLGAYRDTRNFNASKIQGLGTIEDQRKGNFTVKQLAGYNTIEEARQVLREVRNVGFKDAFIVENISGEWRKVK